MSNVPVFLDYVAACEARDVDRVVSFYTDTSTYHNIPQEPISGLAAIRATLNGFFSLCSAIQFEILEICETGTGVVLSERIDRFCIASRWRECRVMGSVEISNGQFVAWREYYDSRQMENAFS